MASLKVVSRLSSRLQLVFSKLNNKPLFTSSPGLTAFKSNSASARRLSCSSRFWLPVEMSCVESMMPLHSAIALARLISSLSTDSARWALVPQGISMPL